MKDHPDRTVAGMIHDLARDAVPCWFPIGLPYLIPCTLNLAPCTVAFLYFSWAARFCGFSIAESGLGSKYPDGPPWFFVDPEKKTVYVNADSL